MNQIAEPVLNQYLMKPYSIKGLKAGIRHYKLRRLIIRLIICSPVGLSIGRSSCTSASIAVLERLVCPPRASTA